MIKYLSVLSLWLFAAQSLLSQNADSAYIRDNYVKKEQYIVMRDGIRLFTSIYIPKDKTAKHPLLLTRTPFSCDPYGETNFNDYWNNHFKQYFRENYIVVTQDVRGKFMSEGEFIDIRPFKKVKSSTKDTDESTDAFDTVDWLINNIADNNRKVGVVGVSYNGFYAVQAALSGHPSIVAVSPQAPVTDWFMGDDFHRNGALVLTDAFGFFTRGFGSPRRQLTTEWPENSFNPPSKDLYNFFLQTGAIPHFTKLAGDSIAFWKEIVSHPDYDSWWRERNTRTSLYNIQPAMLEVGGFYDAEDCFGALNTYRAIENQSPASVNKIVMGPWYHGQWGRNDGTRLGNIQFGSNTSEWYATNIEIPFFNYYLKGKGAAEDIKEANIFFSGANEWRTFTQWPAPNIKSEKIFFHSNGSLSWERPTATNTFTEYISDPAKPVPFIEGTHERRPREYMNADQRFASTRTDVLSFKTPALSEDLTLAGPLIADLAASISTTDADFVVKLIDVFPDDFSYDGKERYVMGGYQMLVRSDVLRGKYRNSFEKPEPFIPGKRSKVKFTMPDVAHTFKKGHRLMIQVQSSWFPLIDRNPQVFTNIYQARDEQFKRSTIKIYHDKDNSSGMILPVLK